MKVLLLQSESGVLFTAFLLCFILFMIVVFITRWIFGIPKILAHLKRQTYLLDVQMHVISKIALKEELTKEDIQKIKETSSAITDTV